MEKFIRDIKNETLNQVRGEVINRTNEGFTNGYNEAANICVGIITEKIEELFGQINSGSYLSEQEQFMLSKLKELKSETEEKLRDFWTTGVN